MTHLVCLGRVAQDRRTPSYGEAEFFGPGGD
jgi:hypothetical protein